MSYNIASGSIHLRGEVLKLLITPPPCPSPRITNDSHVMLE